MRQGQRRTWAPAQPQRDIIARPDETLYEPDERLYKQDATGVGAEVGQQFPQAEAASFACSARSEGDL
jgi:hypothetical protein